MTDSLEVAISTQADLGEGPTWDVRSDTLIWVDITAPAIHRWNPSTGVNETVAAPQHVGAAKPRADGSLVANLRDGIALLDASGARRWLVYWEREGVRGNDAAIDGAGRLWAGTMRYDGAPGGWLARVEPTGVAKVVAEHVECSNGIGWSPDNTLMYFIDSPTHRIDVFDYDLSTGDAHNRRPLCTVSDTSGVPDGLCVDADGCIWVAVWGGGKIRRYTPEGVLDREIRVPVSQPTACCFGGSGFTDLYITSARSGLSEEKLAGQPLAGSVFVIPNAGNGLPSTVFPG